MELLIEFIFELIFESGVEASKSKKVPKVIRYFLIAIFTLLFIAAIGLIYFVSLVSLKENILLALIFFVIATYMLVVSIVKFKNAYIEKLVNNK